MTVRPPLRQLKLSAQHHRGITFQKNVLNFSCFIHIEANPQRCAAGGGYCNGCWQAILPRRNNRRGDCPGSARPGFRLHTTLERPEKNTGAIPLCLRKICVCPPRPECFVMPNSFAPCCHIKLRKVSSLLASKVFQKKDCMGCSNINKIVGLVGAEQRERLMKSDQPRIGEPNQHTTLGKLRPIDHPRVGESDGVGIGDKTVVGSKANRTAATITTHHSGGTVAIEVCHGEIKGVGSVIGWANRHKTIGPAMPLLLGTNERSQNGQIGIIRKPAVIGNDEGVPGTGHFLEWNDHAAK